MPALRCSKAESVVSSTMRAPSLAEFGLGGFSLWSYSWFSYPSLQYRLGSVIAALPPPHPPASIHHLPVGIFLAPPRGAAFGMLGTWRISGAARLGTDPQSSTRLLDREELGAMPLPCGDTVTRMSPPAASVWSCERRNLRAQSKGGPVPLEAAERCGTEPPRELCCGRSGVDEVFTKREQGVEATRCTGCGHRSVVG